MKHPLGFYNPKTFVGQPTDQRHFVDADLATAIAATKETHDGWSEPQWITDLFGLHCELVRARRDVEGRRHHYAEPVGSVAGPVETQDFASKWSEGHRVFGLT